MELFLIKKDAVFLVSLGFNRIRVSLNYCFKDDMDFFFYYNGTSVETCGQGDRHYRPYLSRLSVPHTDCYGLMVLEA